MLGKKEAYGRQMRARTLHRLWTAIYAAIAFVAAIVLVPLLGTPLGLDILVALVIAGVVVLALSLIHRDDPEAEDTFRRRDQHGWGWASNWETWHSVPVRSGTTNLSIERHHGEIGFAGVDPMTGKDCSQWVALDSHRLTDCDARVRFTLTEGSGTRSETAGIFLRLQTNNLHYLARYDGLGHIQFMIRTTAPPPDDWDRRGSAPFEIEFGRAYWLRVVAVHTTVLVKAWMDRDPEPEEWLLEETVAGSAPGGIGLYGFGVDGIAGARFDHFLVMKPLKNLLAMTEP